MDIKKIIQDNLKPGKELKNWTPLRGYNGDNIIITKVDNNSIDFDAPSSKKKTITKASVPYSAIIQIYDLWEDIKSGKLSRTQYTNSGIKNHFTRYCLDILKELENEGLI